MINAPIQHIEVCNEHLRAMFNQLAPDMQHLVALRSTRTLCRKPDDKTFHVTPQTQEQPFAREVNRRNLYAVPGGDDQ